MANISSFSASPSTLLLGGSLFGFGSAASAPISAIDLSPSSSEAWKPFYFHPHASLLPLLSDKYLSLVAPIAVYWLTSLWFQLLDALRLPFTEQYRLHEPEEVTKRNKVSASRVVFMVLLQQIVQTILGIFVLEDEETVYRQVFTNHDENMRSIGIHVARGVCGALGYKQGLRVLNVVGAPLVQWLYWWGIPVVQFWWAFFVMDAWQYALHRAFHESRFLYRHFHSHHHRLYVPYAFGALYNHPLEGLLLDSAGAALSHAVALMTVRQGILLFTFSTLKTVCDHGGYAFPWWLDPLHLVFPNCAEYHDVHHQMQGLRFNYSQPFFVHFDVVFGTRITAEKFDKMKEKRLRENQTIRDGRVPHTETAPAAAAPSASSTSTSVGDTKTDLRKRTPNGSAAAPRDVSAAEISRTEKDPFLTTDMGSYVAKAGSNVGA